MKIEVEVQNEEEAIERAFKEGCSKEDIEEFGMFKHICKRNVLYAPINNIEVQEVED